MAKKVVISQSTVSAGQLEDFFRMIKDGTIGGEELKAFLANPHKFSQGGLTIVRAINILGQAKVITAEQAAKSWGLEASKDAPIHYSEETLRKCAEESKQGKADWRLVYINGLSLREQREKRGTSQSEQPCFYNNDWWLKPTEDSWATKKMEAGYYLINVLGQFGSMSWNKQEKAISDLGREYERCHEAVFSEAILTIYMVNNGERIAGNWWHWGVSADSDGNRVNVGYFHARGLRVNDDWGDSSDGSLRVSVARKFDH